MSTAEVRTTARLDAAIERSIANAIGLHYINAPSHAHAVVRTLSGMLIQLDKIEQDDPLLYAYQLKDVLPEMSSLIIALERWSEAVVHSTPDQIAETGAKL